jgi:hypothetical protein
MTWRASSARPYIAVGLQEYHTSETMSFKLEGAMRPRKI